jgi:uncharacterized membrane protein
MSNRWIGLGIITVAALFGIAVSGQLPEQVPIHWGLNGQVDGYGSRGLALWLAPGIGLVLFVLLSILPHIDPVIDNRGAAFRSTLGRYTNAILLFMALVHVAILGAGLGWHVEIPRVIGVGVGLLFAALGNEMGRLRRNSFAGIRLPWTLADEDVWRESHRMGGRIMLVSGALIAIGSLLLPPVAGAVLVGVVVVGMLIGMIGYSYRVALKKRRAIAAPED